MRTLAKRKAHAACVKFRAVINARWMPIRHDCDSIRLEKSNGGLVGKVEIKFQKCKIDVTVANRKHVLLHHEKPYRKNKED